MKVREKLNKLKNFLYNTVLGNITVIVFVVIWFYGMIYITKTYDSPKQQELNDLDFVKIAEVIKKLESEKPPRISEDPTEEEIYNNDYVKHIRVGLNGYLDGTNTGVEEFSIEESSLDNGTRCGLNSFDKSYYQSKFIVVNALNNDYGGVQGNILFIDKPDTLFGFWVYELGGGEYTLRGFCEKKVPAEEKSELDNLINELIKESEYFL